MSLRDAVLRGYVGDQVIFVSSLTDLPAPSGGVITLANNTTYKIMGTVDISPNRIVCGIRNSVIGEDRLNDILMSDTTGALFTATSGALVLVCNTLTLQALNGSVYDFNAVSLSVSECSPKGATLGTFTNALTVTFRQSGMISAYTTGGATFSGTCSALRVFDNVISGNAGTLFALGTCVFSNAYIDRNNCVINATQTFLSGTTGGANVTVAGILANNIFSGAGTYVNTITEADANWLWTANVGVADTGGGVAWGDITGTLSNQTDLQTALDGKQTTDTTLTALAAYATNGLLTQTAADTFTGRTIVAGSVKLSVSNGSGVAGNPSVDFGSVASTDLSDSASLYKVGGTDVAVGDGGTGASNAADARTSLGLVIGTNVQAWDTQLDSVAALAYAGNALKVVRVNAGEAAFELATPTGGSASATTVEKDLGSTAKWSGRFTITDASITALSKVMCWQAPGPYTGKGTLADEAEMQPVSVITVNPAAGSATVYWQTPPMLAMTVDTQPGGRLNAVGATFDRLINQRMPESVSFKRIGLARGNVKFSYMVLT